MPKPKRPTAEPKPVAVYIRVSSRDQKTDSQRRSITEWLAKSGLGLEGQVSAVATFARTNGAEIVRAYREIETGKRSDRPELLKVIAHAKRSKVTLVIAKLDRLARNVAFTANLMESGVDFVACDNSPLCRVDPLVTFFDEPTRREK
jgi:DNA invertase Pin-like site-specific DNA recombinase